MTLALKITQAQGQEVRNTTDLPEGPTLYLPLGCVTQRELTSLALALARLERLHRGMGGKGSEVPCLKQVTVVKGGIHARIQSGPETFNLRLVGTDWVMD